MANRVFHLNGADRISELAEEGYAKEDDLQHLIERWPELLAGDQINPTEPRRWALVRREMSVGDDYDSSGRWSLDHLLLDQSGILTLVEVKRSSDTRIRREVVGQMLDYAANAVVYWPFEEIRAAFSETCRENQTDPCAEICRLLGVTASEGLGDAVEAFWQQVKTNLAAERVRMIFVADVIPAELRRIVEFLNGQMDPAEVLALELKQYVGGDGKTLVPRVIGQTAKAETTKGTKSRDTRQWDSESFFQACQKSNPSTIPVIQRLVKWFDAEAAGVRWGRGGTLSTFTGRILVENESIELIRVFENGWAQFAIATLPPPIQETVRSGLHAIEGLQLTKAKQYPSGDLAVFHDEAKWQALITVFRRILDAA